MKKVFCGFVGLLLCLGCSEDGEDNADPNMREGNNNDMPAMVEMVAIPDAAFEQALIDLNFDDELDGEVAKNRIDFVSDLIIDDKGISDLTGIAAFDALVNLNVRDNQLTTIDVTENVSLLFLWAEGNQLDALDVNGLTDLEKLGLDQNNLEQIDISENSSLQLLTVSQNELTTIDVSSNNALTDFIVVDNPLNCILVNETQLNTIPTDWSKDEEDQYSLDCQ